MSEQETLIFHEPSKGGAKFADIKECFSCEYRFQDISEIFYGKPSDTMTESVPLCPRCYDRTIEDQVRDALADGDWTVWKSFSGKLGLIVYLPDGTRVEFERSGQGNLIPRKEVS